MTKTEQVQLMTEKMAKFVAIVPENMCRIIGLYEICLGSAAFSRRIYLPQKTSKNWSGA